MLHFCVNIQYHSPYYSYAEYHNPKISRGIEMEFSQPYIFLMIKDWTGGNNLERKSFIHHITMNAYVKTQTFFDAGHTEDKTEH